MWRRCSPDYPILCPQEESCAQSSVLPLPSTSLHIGIVTCDAPPFIGGMGRHVGALTEGLRRQGMHVSVFDRTQRPVLSRFGRNVGFSCDIERLLRRWIEREQITLLHIHTGPGGALLRKKPANIPMIVTANHTYAQQATVPGQSWKRLLIPWERFTYQAADRIICISEDTATIVRHRYGIDPKKIVVIPCGFDLAPWIAADRPADERNPLRCLFVGRPDRRKGWDLLEQAWRIVRCHAPEFQLDVVGFCDDEPTPGIHFHGRVSDGTLRAFLGSTWITVMPSRAEGFGLVAAESIACSTPVVATDVAGLRSVVTHHRTGLLVAPDSNAVAEGMLRLLGDRALWQELHDGCRFSRNRFDLQTEVDAHRKIYEAMV